MTSHLPRITNTCKAGESAVIVTQEVPTDAGFIAPVARSQLGKETRRDGTVEWNGDHSGLTALPSLLVESGVAYPVHGLGAVIVTGVRVAAGWRRNIEYFHALQSRTPLKDFLRNTESKSNGRCLYCSVLDYLLPPPTPPQGRLPFSVVYVGLTLTSYSCCV